MVKQGVSLGELKETYELLNSKGYQVYTGEFECDKYEAMATLLEYTLCLNGLLNVITI